MSANNHDYYAADHYKVDGSGVLYYTDSNEKVEMETSTPIANHSPMLQRIVRKDDGFDIKESVEFSARLNGRNEPAVCIDKKTMIGNQPHVNFSPGCRIYRGRGNIAKYSEFMQIQCEDAKIETVYTHTGWINLDGKRIFLNGENSIDENGLTPDYTVELDSDFKPFCFYPVEDDTAECFSTVMDGIAETVPDRVHIPLMAYTFLTPLNGMLREAGKEPCFSLYLIGKTGSYKSSISKLLLCFFGTFSYATPAPISFEDTQGMVARKMGVGADLPLLLDDRRPTNNSVDRLKYEGMEKKVSSAIGDRAARGRLNSDCTARTTITAKCNLMVTAEEAFVNIGSSSIARSVSIELEPDCVNFDNLQKLQDTPQHFNKVMQLYIQWLIKHWESINKNSDHLLKDYRKLFSEAGHARLATAFSQLMFGYHVFLCFLKDMEQITDEKAEKMLDRAKTIFLTMCDAQSKKVESEKPTTLFVNLLKEMLQSQKVRLKDVDSTSDFTPPNLIGYRDSDYLYLQSQNTYNAVVKFYAESGCTFPASRDSLWKMFMDEGKIRPGNSRGKNTSYKVKKIQGKSIKAIWLMASVLNENDDEKEEDLNE